MSHLGLKLEVATWPTRSLRPQGLHEKSFSGARKPSKGEDERYVHHRQARGTGLVDILTLTPDPIIPFKEVNFRNAALTCR